MVDAITDILIYYLEDIEAYGQGGSPRHSHILQTGPQPLTEEKGLFDRENRVQDTGLETSHDPPET